MLMVPDRVLQVIAPFLFGLCVDRWGSGALWLSAGLGLSALCSLLVLTTFLPRSAVKGN
jgi:hypothetical protein